MELDNTSNVQMWCTAGSLSRNHDMAACMSGVHKSIWQPPGLVQSMMDATLIVSSILGNSRSPPPPSLTLIGCYLSVIYYVCKPLVPLDYVGKLPVLSFLKLGPN